MLLIGITGTLGAGKGAVVEYLKEKHGFAHFSARDFIAEEIARRGLPVNRDALIAVGNILRAEHGAGYVAEALCERAAEVGKPVVIESLRAVGDVEAVRRAGNALVLAVDADQRVRYERIAVRKSATDSVTFAEFCAHEAQEMHSLDHTKQNLGACMALADHVLMNNGTLEDLHAQVDAVFATISVMESSGTLRLPPDVIEKALIESSGTLRFPPDVIQKFKPRCARDDFKIR